MASRANKIAAAAIAIVVIVAVALIAWPHVSPVSGELRALVHDGDGATHELSLAQDSETTITTSLGMNVVVVENGTVYVRDADCDNHDCIRQGHIDAPGSQIICLPHKLWIEVVAPGDAPGQMNPDATANAEGLDVTTR